MWEDGSVVARQSKVICVGGGASFPRIGDKVEAKWKISSTWLA
jgi:hypothetical protein